MRTNVVLHYLVPPSTLPFDDAPDRVTGEYTLRTASGEQVPLVVTRPASSLLKLTPQQPLQPNTAYTLDAHWTLPDGREADTVVTFGTGDGPSAAAPPPPAAVLRGYEMKPSSALMCASQNRQLCLGARRHEPDRVHADR